MFYRFENNTSQEQAHTEAHVYRLIDVKLFFDLNNIVWLKNSAKKNFKHKK